LPRSHEWGFSVHFISVEVEAPEQVAEFIRIDDVSIELSGILKEPPSGMHLAEVGSISFRTVAIQLMRNLMTHTLQSGFSISVRSISALTAFVSNEEELFNFFLECLHDKLYFCVRKGINAY
tara:strand:+ start:580 stop:945 length:366 start_codon:yes stop_codon:yes gene_type:complete